MKLCTKCGETKSESDFHRQQNRKKDGFYISGHCKTCERQYQLQYKKDNAKPNVPLVLPAGHQYENGRVCSECNEFHRADKFGIERDGRAFGGISMRSKCKRCTEIRKSKSFLIKNYKITFDQYLELLKYQKNRCAICGSRDHKNKRTGNMLLTFFVDHDHETGKVRGLLCSPCNHALGQFNDNIDTLNKAVTYLAKPPASWVL
jgi:hypothetical protein|tara:strand:+ start:159 stop:770 length:612 start_codon:yes stop_codon:yes gene_type:complete